MKKEFLKNYFLQAESRMKDFHHDNGDGYDDDGYDDDGYDDDGYDDDGYDDDGYDDDGFDDDGFEDEGYDDDGYDDDGFDDDGYEHARGRKRRKKKGKKNRNKRVAAGVGTAAAVVATGGAAAGIVAARKRKKNKQRQQKTAPMNQLPISKSYQLSIVNSLGTPQTVSIFNSRKNRTAANFGNPVGVTITYLRPNFDYVSLLADTEQMDLKIGLIRIDSTNTAQLNTPVQWQRITSDGRICGDAVDNFQNLYQNLTTSVQAPADFKLTGNTELLYPLLNGVTVSMFLFPSHLVNAGRLLSGKNAVMGFTDPYLGGVQKVKLVGQ